MLLIDDPRKTVIQPLTAAADKMESVCDFDLMENGGHIQGLQALRCADRRSLDAPPASRPTRR